MLPLELLKNARQTHPGKIHQFHIDLALILCLLTQYYDDTAGILRSVILSAVAPHRMSASPMPMPRQDSSAGPIVLPMASPLEEPIFTAFEDDVEDS